MKVSLLNYTGLGACNPSGFAARLLIYTKLTRLTQGDETREKIFSLNDEEVEEQLQYIANTIRSSWEFIDYTFQIEGVTRAFTHQFVRNRHGSYAQESQRTVSKEGGFTAEMPEAFGSDLCTLQENEHTWDFHMTRIQDMYDEWIAKGYSPQDARAVLPTNIHTNIIAKFNLRTMADMIPKRENTRAQGEFQEVARLMGEEMLRVHPWVKPFLWPERHSTPNLDAILKRMVGDKCPAEIEEVNSALKEVDKLKKTWG